MGATRDIWITASALSLILSAQADAADNSAREGIAGYVRAPASGQTAGGQTRRLHIGDAVFKNEKIVTGPGGSAQIIMQDRSTITVGPGAELMISEYRYDRQARDGNMAIRALKGLFRFVGGFVSKHTPVRVSVPTGTIGIRGAIVTIDLLPDGGVRMTFFYGNDATYTGDNGDEITLNQGGTVVEIGADGTVGEPEQASPEYLKALQERLTGDKGEPVLTTEVSDPAGMAIVESLSNGDQQLNIEILEHQLDIDGAQYEDVRDALEEIIDSGSGG